MNYLLTLKNLSLTNGVHYKYELKGILVYNKKYSIMLTKENNKTRPTKKGKTYKNLYYFWQSH